MNAQSGTVLGHRYTLTNRIAGGGMGDVWQADDSVLGRTVAVKVMRPHAADEAAFADRFRDEARHTAALSHPNIATVYDYGEDDGLAYLVMELVDGQPLSQLIAQAPMSAERTRSIVGQAALALAAAHAAGVVHRDVKPANILVTSEGRVKLTDFGIARAADSASHTRTGEVLGTPHYLSPEQALGRQATGASDLYSLGIVAHEMLTGIRPFDSGSAVATALAQVNDAPPPLPVTVPADLQTVVMSCLEKDPVARPASAAALAQALGMPVGGLAAASPATAVLPAAAAGATQVIPHEPSPSTAVLPAAAPTRIGPVAAAGASVGPPRRPSERRRGAAAWWLLPVLVAVLALGFLAWQYLSGPAQVQPPMQTVFVTGTATPPPTTPGPALTTTPSPTLTTPATKRVTIKDKDYVGKPVDEVVAALQDIGFANISTSTVADKAPKGEVTAISPTGNLPVDTPIRLTVSDGSLKTKGGSND